MLWMHWLLYFLCGLACTAPLGVGSYFLGQWFRRVKPSWATFLDYLFALLGLIVFNLYLLFVVPLCLGGAYAMRASEGRKKATFYDFVKLLSSTTLPSLLCGFVFLVIALFLHGFYDSLVALASAKLTSEEEIFALLGGAYFGFIATPSVVPIVVWVWKSSKLQPGVDRLLVAGEEGHVQNEIL